MSRLAHALRFTRFVGRRKKRKNIRRNFRRPPLQRAKKVLPRPSADRQSLIFNPLCPEENPVCSREPPPMQANVNVGQRAARRPVEKRRNRTESARSFENIKLYLVPLHKKRESCAEVGQLFVGTMQRVFFLQAEHIQNGAVKEIRKLYQISGTRQICA